MIESKIHNIETPIVLAFTPNYLVPAATTILSILETSPENSSFNIICLMAKPLSSDMKVQLELIDKRRLRFTFINLENKELDIYVDQRYTIAASYRLLLPELLPSYDKVLYIDCDVIVRNNLSSLYHKTNIENYYLAGVIEPTLSFQREYIESLGIENGEYINSGLLLLNLKKLREGNMVSKFLEASKKEGLQFPDQDVINILCKGQILSLHPIYNSIRTFFLPQYKSDFLKRYTDEDWMLVQSIGNIHYTGGKPWDNVTVKLVEWWEVYTRLPNAIKANFNINRKIYCYYKLNQNTIIRNSIDFIKNLYRKFKSS